MESDLEKNHCDEPLEKVAPYILVSFGIGIAFGSVSGGLLPYALWLLFVEVPYAVWIKFQYTPQNTIKRLAFYSASFIGFLVARVFVCDDFNPIRARYDEKPTYTKAVRSLLLMETSEAVRARRTHKHRRFRGVFSRSDAGP